MGSASVASRNRVTSRVLLSITPLRTAVASNEGDPVIEALMLLESIVYERVNHNQDVRNRRESNNRVGHH